MEAKSIAPTRSRTDRLRSSRRQLSSAYDRRTQLDDELALIDRRLGAASSTVEVMKVILDDVRTMSGAIMSVAYLVGPAPGQLTIAGARGVPAATTSRLATVPVTFPLPVAAVVLAGRALWFRDRAALVTAYPDFFGFVRKDEIQSLAALPLRCKGGVLGGFAAGFSAPHLFTDDDLELLMVASELAAHALDRCGRDQAR